MSDTSPDTIIDEIIERIFPSTKGLPKAHQYTACKILGKKYRFNGKDWVCENDVIDQTEPDQPFYRDPTDEHNPSRPTNPTEPPETSPTPEPRPKPKPRSVDPPTTYERDPFGERRVIPVPPLVELPDIPPSIPIRRLPKIDAAEDENALEIAEKRLVKVEEDALGRTYGCMLHSPITGIPAIYRQCKVKEPEEDDSAAEGAKKFFEYLIRKISDNAVDEALTGTCVLTALLLPNNFLRYLPGGKLALTFGCDVLTDIAADFLWNSNNAYQDVDGQGHINVEFIQCDPEDEDIEEPTTGLDLKRADFQLNECFVPIRNFKDNEPEQLGMKKQLQVIYELEEGDQKYQKVITVPSPKEDIDAELLRQVFPEELDWGEVKLETSISPYGYLRFYSTQSGIDGYAYDLFDDIVDILIEGFEVENSRRYSVRARKHKTGTFQRKQGFLFAWNKGDGSAPLCNVFWLR